jgi:hypothetical protein
MLNLVPGPGVHPERPAFSISQSPETSVALPDSRHPMPITAIGSSEPGPALVLWSSDVLLSLSLSKDHGEEESLSLSDSLSALSTRGLDAGLMAVIIRKARC